MRFKSKVLWTAAASVCGVGALVLSAIPADTGTASPRQAAIGAPHVATDLSLAKTVPGDASPAGSVSQASDSDLPTKYSDQDIVEFLLFGRGRIAVDEPYMITRLHITPNTTAPASAVADAVARLKAADPAFHANVTVRLQRHDPYQAEAGFAAFKAALKTAVSKQRPPVAVRADFGDFWVVTTNWAVLDNQAVQSFEVVTSFGVVAEAFAVWLAFYEHSTGGTAFDAQNAAQALAGL